MIDRVLAGRYKIISAIGEGGMSRVWRAQDLNTGKMVAVKVLREEYRDDEVFVRRFEREAQAASRMSHPNIVNLLDVGLEDDGTRYLVIEYISGKTLKQFIRESNGPVRPEIAANMIMRVLAGVQHAHQNGVIHRDIKPQNILIDKEGNVKVADFGIARVVNAQTTSQDSETVMGSVYYFSPEQAKGNVVDEKGDLYSVGVVFYELLTGEVPFTGDTPVAIAMQHIEKEAPLPSEKNPAVSPALDFVVQCAMAKRPQRRYASAGEMMRDLRLAMEHPDTILAARAEIERQEREVRARQRREKRTKRRVKWMRRALLGAFTVALLALLVFAGYTVMERILLSRKNSIEVPNFIGMHWEEGAALARELGMEPYIREDTYEMVPEGIVFDQTIAPGTFAAPGDQITLIAFKSLNTIKAPTVTGLYYLDARDVITRLGLLLGEIDYVPDKAEHNMVIAQDPEPGTGMNPGDTVNLTVSRSTVTMPQLEGITQAQAIQTIEVMGLYLDEAMREATEDPNMVGKVIAQTPPALSQVMRGSSVRIVIGSPGDAWYQADIRVDLSGITKETEVSVRVMDEEGRETVWYTELIDEAQEAPVFVSVYSKTVRDAQYHIYFDDEMVDNGMVSFK